MRLSNKGKWLIPTLIFIILFISFSVYRYNQVNEPYQNYAVIEKTQHSGQGFTRDGLTLTYGEPSVKEEQEWIYYEVPLTVKNDSSETKNVPYDRFHLRSNKINNMLNFELFIEHPANRERSRDSILPGTTEELVLVFTMQKEWGVTTDTNADLYLLEATENSMIKHKLSLNY
ncbi:hypothetical protein J9303_04680 [Bacillaceae bacterium Marseille-Q3522]|nr:hypothetical protein [Bacillaceae bacterium Marseille-Q3522]